jgi:formate dehydrogenase assembly factor FdhD
MKTLALSFLLAASVVSSAQAMTSSTIDSSQHSTSQLQNIIQQQGSVILSTGPGLFDRYVANRSHCGLGQETQTAFVPTADSKDGFVGYRCVVDTDEG